MLRHVGQRWVLSSTLKNQQHHAVANVVKQLYKQQQSVSGANLDEEYGSSVISSIIWRMRKVADRECAV